MACSKFMAGAVGASMLVLGVVPGAALAGGAAGTVIGAAPLLRTGGGEPLRVLHRHRAQSFYCYPKNYWWFYRPYTTAFDGHARCMPYFHYLGPARRGSDQYIK